MTDVKIYRMIDVVLLERRNLYLGVSIENKSSEAAKRDCT